MISYLICNYKKLKQCKLEIPLPCYLTKFESGILKIHEYIIVGVQSHTVAHFSLLRTIDYVLYHNANTLHGAFSSFPVLVFPIFFQSQKQRPDYSQCV